MVGFQRWLVALCIVMLTACGGSAPAQNDEAPVQVVKDFVAAAERRDASAMLNLLEPTDWREQIGPELRSYTNQVEQVEIRNPTYTLQDRTDQESHVRVQGTVAYTLRGAAFHEQPIDTTIELVNIDNIWYIRGVEMPIPDSFPTPPQ